MADPGTPKIKERERPAKRGNAVPTEMDASEVAVFRELFWHNIVRETLSGLAVVAQHHPEMMDGRFAVLTHGGERIPIANVEPVFAYTVRGARRSSSAVQLTIFRITTPEGEVFTLPVHEVRAMHELTPELIAQLQQSEDEEQDAVGESERRPFGFAAFAALPRRGIEPPPMQPME